MIAAAGAVANAITAATGTPVHRLPMTPPRVWAAIVGPHAAAPTPDAPRGAAVDGAAGEEAA